MRSYRIPLCLLLAVPALAAADVDFHSDVMPVIVEKCTTCHAESGVSFSLEDADTAYNFRNAIASAVHEDRMPPWLAEGGHQEYVGDYSLTADEKAVISEWASNGFPRGAAGTSTTLASNVEIFAADLSMDVIADGEYLPNQQSKDDYHCFIVEWPYETDMYVTGFKAAPGNLRVAHHLVNFVVAPEAVDVLMAASNEEEGNGHSCFGSPFPDRLGKEAERAEFESRYPNAWETLTSNYFWLSQWAPGAYGDVFPEGTGILIRPGSAIVVQMHYYSAFAPGETDQDTKMLFQVAANVDKPSFNLPLSDNRWLVGRRNHLMEIPAGEEATYEVQRSFDRIAGYAAHALDISADEIEAIELRSANLHMHAFGASATTSLLHPSGRKEILLRIPRWDLDWQRDYRFIDKKVIARDDFDRTRLVAECTFSNYTDELVYGGYGSDDEMCFNFSYISVVRGQAEAVASTP